jgi:hypothetical protein
MMTIRGSLVAAALLAMMLAGCGDDDGGAGGPSDVVFSRTVRIGPEGGQIDSGAHGVRVTVPPGALARRTAVTLAVHAEQFDEVQREGYAYSPNGARLTVDTSALAAGATVELRVPLNGPYDELGSLLGIQAEDGTVHALPSQSAGAAGIDAQLAQPVLAALAAEVGSPEPQTLMVFTANRLDEGLPPPLITAVLPFENGQFAGEVPDLSGATVAVVVHGIEADLADLVQLGQFLSEFTRTGESSPYYDVVIGFQYTSNADLATIGTAMADSMEQVGLQDAAVVDLIAHSMGNPVSRYALETTALPNRIANVSTYVSLGGPHTGVPFGQFMHTEQLFFYLFDPASKPCLLDLLTDGENGAPQTDFLTDLNLEEGQMGPNFHTTRYFTMSGDDYRAEAPPLGSAVHLLYLLTVGSDEPEDGLVAQYSAQSEVLARQSATWSPNPPLPLSHTQLHTSPLAFMQIATWLDSAP